LKGLQCLLKEWTRDGARADALADAREWLVEVIAQLDPDPNSLDGAVRRH